MYGDAIQKTIVVTDNDIVIDYTERSNDIVVTNLCLGADYCKRMYLIHITLFVFDNLSSKGCFGYDAIANKDIAFHGGNSMSDWGEQVNLE